MHTHHKLGTDHELPHGFLLQHNYAPALFTMVPHWVTEAQKRLSVVTQITDLSNASDSSVGRSHQHGLRLQHKSSISTWSSGATQEWTWTQTDLAAVGPRTQIRQDADTIMASCSSTSHSLMYLPTLSSNFGCDSCGQHRPWKTVWPSLATCDTDNIPTSCKIWTVGHRLLAHLTPPSSAEHLFQARMDMGPSTVSSFCAPSLV